MRLLWPQSLRVELARLLSRCTSACSAYPRAVLLFWSASPADRNATERRLLAPARRACGLTSQNVEEALDRILLDHNSDCASTPHAHEYDAADTEAPFDPASPAEQMLQRMERQACVLERAATNLAIASPPALITSKS